MYHGNSETFLLDISLIAVWKDFLQEGTSEMTQGIIMKNISRLGWLCFQERTLWADIRINDWEIEIFLFSELISSGGR